MPYNSMLQGLWGYSAVDSDEEKNDSEGSAFKYQQPRDYYNFLLKYAGWILSFVLAVVLVTTQKQPTTQDSQDCFRKTASYSPILNELDPGHLEFPFNGSIRWPSPYRGPPSPEVDEAWSRISIVRPLNLSISPEDFWTIGSDPETAATNAPEHGGGYFMVPEFTHQLHCVNLLRKASYFKFEYYDRFDPDFTDNRETFKVHLDHCVEMLRQFVMCHADVGIVTAHWIEQRSAPWPDFNTKHVCRDFERVLAWTHDHQLPEGTPLIPLKPEGARALSTPP